jgi:phosphoglycerate dehydrogenase-like enzyme
LRHVAARLPFQFQAPPPLTPRPAADVPSPSCSQIFADAGHKLVEKKMKLPELVEAISG